jgi:hypothetical protein
MPLRTLHCRTSAASQRTTDRPPLHWASPQPDLRLDDHTSPRPRTSGPTRASLPVLSLHNHSSFSARTHPFGQPVRSIGRFVPVGGYRIMLLLMQIQFEHNSIRQRDRRTGPLKDPTVVSLLIVSTHCVVVMSAPSDYPAILETHHPEIQHHEVWADALDLPPAEGGGNVDAPLDSRTERGRRAGSQDERDVGAWASNAVAGRSVIEFLFRSPPPIHGPLPHLTGQWRSFG